MRHLLVLIAILFASTGLLEGQDRYDAEAHAKVVAPFVDEQTVLVGHVDFTKLDPAAIAKLLRATGLIP